MSELPPVVDLRALHAFVVVADERHFGRAAARLGISQPPLSQQIQRLERRLGCQLFDRTRRRIDLTRAGEVLLPAALRALDETDRGVRDARRAAAGETGTLRIAFPASLGLTDVPEAVSRFRRENPGVDIELSEATSALQIEYLRSERIDVGFLREEEDVPGLVTERLATEPLVAILPIDHPLGHGRHIEVSALRDEPFVLFPPTAGEAFHRRIVGVCEDAGFRPNVVQEATEWTTIIGLVAAGIGITIAPDSCRALSPRTVAHRPLEPACTTLVVLAWRADHSEDPVRDRFVAAVRQQCPLTA